MKFLQLLFVCALAFSFEASFAQTATEGLRPFVKRSSGNAVSIIYTGQPANVKEVLESWMSEASGDRASNRNGFRAFEGVRVQAFSESTLDYYLKVDKVSRQDKEHAEVTLFVSAGNDNFLTSSTDPEVMNELMYWLESMQQEVTIYELELAIEAQQKVIEKAQKQYDRLQQDSIRLQADLAETLADIEENKVSNTTQRGTIASEELQLQAFREELDIVRRGPVQEEAVMRTTDELEEDVEGEIMEVEEIQEIQEVEEAPIQEVPASGGGNG